MTSKLASSKRRRLGDFLGSKSGPETASANSPLPGNAPAASPQDKASSNHAEIVPIENHGQVSGVDVQRNLAVNESTGQVVDDDTGEVLTVTTTTTTTTTTETRRSRSPQPPPNGNTTAHAEQVTQPAPQPNLLDPNSALQPSDGGAGASQEMPVIEQVRSQPEPSTAATIGSPPPNDTPHSPLQPASSRSAIENLKSAAAGLHDAGSHLRGTLYSHNSNDTDKIPLPRRNPARKGRMSSSQDIPPVPPVPATMQEQKGQSQWQAPWPDPPEEEMGENERLKKRKSLSSMPATFSPESSGTVGREKSPRLWKRAKNGRGAA